MISSNGSPDGMMSKVAFSIQDSLGRSKGPDESLKMRLVSVGLNQVRASMSILVKVKNDVARIMKTKNARSAGYPRRFGSSTPERVWVREQGSVLAHDVDENGDRARRGISVLRVPRMISNDSLLSGSSSHPDSRV